MHKITSAFNETVNLLRPHSIQVTVQVCDLDSVMEFGFYHDRSRRPRFPITGFKFWRVGSI